MFTDIRVLVVGDVMIDEYLWGQARRISPEAPVPVVELTSRSHTPGGAANVAANIAALGGDVRLAGLIGADDQGRILRGGLQARGLDCSGLFVDSLRPTTAKTRIMAQQQQIARLDSECRAQPPLEIQEAMLAWVEQELELTGVLVLSDYSKGALPERMTHDVIQAARHRGKPVVIDPKARNFERYRGATVLTPNVAEACRAAGQEHEESADLAVIGGRLTAQLGGLTALLITRGADGMSLFRTGESPLHIPACARAVYDVTGAGDTVVATLALAIAAGLSLEDAAHLANRAAGMVVGKVGTACVTPDELFGGTRSSHQSEREGRLAGERGSPLGYPHTETGSENRWSY